MDYLWDFPEGTSFREIYKHFTEVKGRDWKRQTLYTYLTGVVWSVLKLPMPVILEKTVKNV